MQSCSKGIQFFQSKHSPLGVTTPYTPVAGGRVFSSGPFTGEWNFATCPSQPRPRPLYSLERPLFDVGLNDKQSLFRSALVNSVSHFMACCDCVVLYLPNKSIKESNRIRSPWKQISQTVCRALSFTAVSIIINAFLSHCWCVFTSY